MEKDEEESDYSSYYYGSVEHVRINMDAKIEEKVLELVNIVKNSEEYKNNLMCRETLKEDAQLYQKVNRFRMKNFLLQVEGNTENLYDEIGRLQSEFEPVRRDIRVSGFLQYEHSMCRTIQQIEEKLLGEIDFDVEFLEEDHD